ncbi:hypothetical protein FLL45_08775 [Aliikangiella marina]|uniref:Uncharacterized protein n=1 Tax=Aliikangiella marina TaxID=1712262 RepID=A0A545TCT4_9GAMM|nr:hypothetical protein [Aliikangiella marina]TQV75025.1 hypothetical protein FLL45_08775 [Aliikangiella marina]
MNKLFFSLVIIGILDLCGSVTASEFKSIDCGSISLEVVSSFQINRGFHSEEKNVDFCYYQNRDHNGNVTASFQVLRRLVNEWTNKPQKELNDIALKFTKEAMKPLLALNLGPPQLTGPVEIATNYAKYFCYRTRPKGSNVSLGLVCNAALPNKQILVRYHREHKSKVTEKALDTMFHSVRYN